MACMNDAWWSLLKHVYKNSEIDESIPPIEINDKVVESEAVLPDQNRIIINGPTLQNLDISLQDVNDQKNVLTVRNHTALIKSPLCL